MPPGRLGGGQSYRIAASMRGEGFEKNKRIIDGCAIWGHCLWDSTLTMRSSHTKGGILDWLEVPPMPPKMAKS